MIIQIVAISLLVAIALLSFLIFNRMNRTYYIEYTESGNIDYKVQYESNDFFEDEWIEMNKEYISSLVKGIAADFKYKLNMDATGVGFEYNYSIDASILISNTDSGKLYFSQTEELLPPTNASTKRSIGVEINESVFVDYNKYNEIASEFIRLYALKHSSSILVVTLNVEVLSSSNKFEQSNENKYSTSLRIPLATDTFSIEQTSSAPQSESKVIAYSGAKNQQIFFITGIVSSSLAVLLSAFLIAFLHITRNEDITYAAKIKKLLRSYGSYIQRIEGDFDGEGYQLVTLKTFTEMLYIRDTIQSPILMSENKDETATRFLIPTNTKLLYAFEIKVDNYDEIYSKAKAESDDAENTIEEAVILADTVDVEDIAEAMAQPDVILSDVDFEKDDDDEFLVAPEEPGVEVIGVVWPEREKKNKVYRYDPNGEQLEEGDLVLVPTKSDSHTSEVIRKAAVAHGNHRVDPEHIKHPLKKIIGVIKRKAEAALTPNSDNNE